MPIIFPNQLMHDIKCETLSEKNRYEKITKLFSELKVFIENSGINDYELVKEVRLSDQINQ